MSQARDPREEGISAAVEMIRALKSMRGVRGIHIMPTAVGKHYSNTQSKKRAYL